MVNVDASCTNTVDYYRVQLIIILGGSSRDVHHVCTFRVKCRMKRYLLAILTISVTYQELLPYLGFFLLSE